MRDEKRGPNLFSKLQHLMEKKQLTSMEHYGVKKSTKGNDLFGEYSSKLLDLKDYSLRSPAINLCSK